MIMICQIEIWTTSKYLHTTQMKLFKGVSIIGFYYVKVNDQKSLKSWKAIDDSNTKCMQTFLLNIFVRKYIVYTE